MVQEILIFGAGAIGAFYGSRLAANANVNVSCVCRSNFDAVKGNGFVIKSPQFGNVKWMPTRTFQNATEAQGAKIRWDYIVVSTKALPDVSDGSAHLEGLVDQGTTIVLIQNGLGIEGPYYRRYATAVILSAVTIASAAQPEYGVIQHNRWTKIDFGPYPVDNEDGTKKSRMLCELLTKAEIPDATPCSAPQLQLIRWHKVAINAAMSPSSVLSGGNSVAVMVNDPDMSEHLKGVIEEVFNVAHQVMRQPFPKGFASADQILNSSGKSLGVPSMLTDWESGRKMELEVILGNPIRQAQAHGLDMPRLKTMYALLKTAQAVRDKQSRL